MGADKIPAAVRAGCHGRMMEDSGQSNNSAIKTHLKFLVLAV